jgi:hypothetical protein
MPARSRSFLSRVGEKRSASKRITVLRGDPLPEDVCDDAGPRPCLGGRERYLRPSGKIRLVRPT